RAAGEAERAGARRADGDRDGRRGAEVVRGTGGAADARRQVVELVAGEELVHDRRPALPPVEGRKVEVETAGVRLPVQRAAVEGQQPGAVVVTEPRELRRVVDRL